MNKSSHSHAAFFAGLFSRHYCFIGYWINISKSAADLKGSTWRRVLGLVVAARADSGNATLVSWESLNFHGDYPGLGGTATESGMFAEGGAQPIIVHKHPTSVHDKTACTFKLSEPDASGAVQMELLAAPGMLIASTQAAVSRPFTLRR